MKWFLLAISLVSLAMLTACDKEERPITFQNMLMEALTLRVLDGYGAPVAFSRVGGTTLADEINVLGASEVTIQLDRLASQPRYTFVAGLKGNDEVFRRTFSRDELENRKWRVRIDDNGFS